jgi:hypothetical protein
MNHELPVVNLHSAKFECTFGRGCDGVCCREGRPPVYADEIERIAENLPKFLPHMRAQAARMATRNGFLSGRKRYGEPLMRVTGGWCIFFNEGCVLHKVGVAEGDKFRYKPAICSLFPIQQDDHDHWYIRQKGFKRERWELSCLDPSNTTKLAAESLQEELALAKRFDDEAREAAVEPTTASPAPRESK